MNSKLLIASLVGSAFALFHLDAEQQIQQEGRVHKEIRGRLVKNEQNQWLAEWRGMVDGQRGKQFYRVSDLDVERLDRPDSVLIFHVQKDFKRMEKCNFFRIS